ncbi:hypothetical protein ACWC5I_14920 [Kitasatospora sp. NPDC001574]
MPADRLDQAEEAEEVATVVDLIAVAETSLQHHAQPTRPGPPPPPGHHDPHRPNPPRPPPQRPTPTLRRHLRGTRRPAGRKLRTAVTDLFQREFCVQNQLDNEVRRVREESGRARRHTVLEAREEEDQWLRQAVLKRYPES